MSIGQESYLITDVSGVLLGQVRGHQYALAQILAHLNRAIRNIEASGIEGVQEAAYVLASPDGKKVRVTVRWEPVGGEDQEGRI